MGFRKYDVMVMSEACHATHLSNESLIVKHSMLEGLRLLRDQAPEVWSPLEGTSTPIFPWTAVDIDTQQNRQVVFNASPIANENCGGADPLFPFTGEATKGTISFHTSLATVPLDFSNTIAVSSDLCGGPQAQEMLAWFMGLHAPWPWCNIGLWIDTFDIADPNKRQIFYNWIGGLAFLDGEININVLLPRRTGTRVTNEREAKAASAIVPRFGPVPTQSWPAGYEMSITPDTAEAGDVYTYDLADYLFSWIEAIATSPVLSRGYRWLLSSGLVAEESKIMGDIPAIFWSRTGCKSVATKGQRPAINLATRAAGLAPGVENAGRTWLWHCGEIPRLDANVVWTNWRPEIWDASLPAVRKYSHTRK